MPTPFRFALCADDYAMAPGVSRGIREALAAARLSATSAMTTSEAWPEEAVALRPFVGRADLGLHLNLTQGRPLGPMPSLAPDGTLPTIGTMIRRLRGGTIPQDEIAAEIGRQLDGFASHMGRPPDHVDGHQHVQVLPAIRRPLLAVLIRRGWTPWLRDSADRPSRILRRAITPVKAAGVAWLARGFAAEAAEAGLAVNNGFAGFSTFGTKPTYGESFARYLIAPGAAHLVMCHPGYVDDALRRIDPVVESRERELGFLLSPAFETLMERRGAVMAPMTEHFRED